MSWDRQQPEAPVSKASTEELLTRLTDAQAQAAALPRDASRMIARFVDEAAARLREGGRLWLVAAGSTAHLVHFAIAETRHWFGESVPLGAITWGDFSGPTPLSETSAANPDEEAIRKVEEKISPDDIVLCASRSGSGSSTAAAIRKANLTGALTASITCMPDSAVARESDMPIVIATGAELVMGCTQYRAATVLKITLDAILLGLAVRAGALVGDVPVHASVGPDSWRLVAAATGVSHLDARSILARANGDVPVAIVMAKLGVDPDEA